jgi:hypothetical protein
MAIKPMFDEEPEPLDESDPEVEQEFFETMKEMGTPPEAIVDLAERERYQTFLDEYEEDDE